MKSAMIAIVTSIVLATAAPAFAVDSRDGGSNDPTVRDNLHTQAGQDHFWEQQGLNR